MADIRKTFNFRAGVQVDDDVFIVRGEQVGIGTTIPTQSLDVRGNAKVVGILTAQNTDFSAGISTFGDVKIGTGISISASSGIITATSFSGDGSQLQNVPTSSWTQYNQLDDNGLSVVSIAKSTGNVGVATTGASSNNDFQVGSDPQDGFSKGVGIGSDGNIYASGIITATTFRGTLVGTVSTVTSTQGNFSDHISVGNTVSVGGTVGFGSTAYFRDDASIRLGDSEDLQIYHDSINGHSYLKDSGTGNLILQSDNEVELITFNPPAGGGSEKMLVATKNEGVKLYFDGNEKLNTASSGVNITGITTTDDLNVSGVSTFTGNIDADGNLDLNGNLNVAGVSTLTGNIHVTGVGSSVGIGTTDPGAKLDVRGNIIIQNIYPSIFLTDTDSNDDFSIQNQNGVFAVRDETNSENRLNIDSTGNVGINSSIPTAKLDVNGNTKLQGDLNVSGVSTLGVTTTTGNVGIGSSLLLGYNKKAIFNDNLQIFAGNDSVIRHTKTGPYSLTLETAGAVYVGTVSLAETMAAFRQTSVDLYYSNQIKFKTSGIGATIYGQLDTTDLNVSGVSTFVGNSKFNGLLGIQTASPQTQLHVWDNAAQVARFQSNQTTSIISFVDETSTITPYIGANSNDLILGSVSGGERLRITGIGGSLGIGQTNPEQTLHVVGTSTVTGNSFFGGTVSIVGNTTINANLDVDSLTVPSLNAHIIGNNAKIHSTSGISTVAAFRATGISTFSGNVTVTDGNTFQVNDGVKRFFVSASGKVGIKTTAGEDDVTIAGDTLFKTSVAVGNTARCAVDFSEVVNVVYNDGTDRSKAAYMLPPIVTTAQRNALVDGRNTSNPAINGSIVFNSDAGRLEIRDGDNWYGIGTVA